MNQSISARHPDSAVFRARALGWAVSPGERRGRARLPRGEELIDKWPDLYGPLAEVCLCDEDDCTTVRRDGAGHLCIHCGQGFDAERNCFGCCYREDDDGNLSLREDDGHGLHG